MNVNSLRSKYSLGSVLLGLNLLILVTLIFTKDPFGIRKTGYYAETPLVSQMDSLNMISIQTLKSSFPVDEFEIRLIRKIDTPDLFGFIPTERKERSASQETLKEFIESLREIRTYTPIGNDKSKYGFDKLEYRIRLIRSTHSEPIEFLISGEGDTMGGSYLFFKDQVYLLPYSIHTILGRDPKLSLLRKKFLPDLTQSNEVLSINLSRNGKIVYSLQKESEDWYLYEPKSRRLEEEGILKILNSLVNWNASDIFLSPKKEWKRTYPTKIQIGVKNGELPKIYSLECNWKDESENPICFSNDGDVYLQMDRYELDLLIERSEKDFP